MARREIFVDDVPEPSVHIFVVNIDSGLTTPDGHILDWKSLLSVAGEIDSWTAEQIKKGYLLPAEATASEEEEVE